MRETTSLKALSSNVLARVQRNIPRNKHETRHVRGAFQAPLQKSPSCPVSSLQEDFEERLAIAEYDGHQTPLQAQRIAYQDAFIAVLATLPWTNFSEREGDWFEERIKKTKEWLNAHNLEASH